MISPLRSAGHAVATLARAAQRSLASGQDDRQALAYVSGATDRIDLELRTRELSGGRRHLDAYPTNFRTH